jgi:hypothetical protein
MFHAVCDCIDWQGNRIPDCEPKDSSYPVQSGQCMNRETGEYKDVRPDDCAALGDPWYWETCYCCCLDPAKGAQVAAPKGSVEIGDVAVGDQVFSASRKGDTWAWSPQTVQFSSSGPARSAGSQGRLLYLEYGPAPAQWLLATPDQLFLTPGGKLKRADRLVPGRDALVSDRGQPVKIERIRDGKSCSGVHHIATNVVSYEEFSGSIT